MTVDPVRSDIALLYRRAGFGLRGGELDALVPAGYEAAVEGLISGLAGPDPAGDAVAAPTFPDIQLPGRMASASERQAVGAELRAGLMALQEWWMQRMVATSSPLREKLTLFWHGHFATGASKVRDPKLMYLQNQLFRTRGSGSFEALTQAVAKDGAMMFWLDTETDKKGHPNENFARELMELFTIGIGNYTQLDVTAAARSFTGWAYDRRSYRYFFQPAQHDYGTKVFLDRSGDLDGSDIISILVGRPESARFVVAKLWSHFAYPVAPGDPVVDDVIGAYGPGFDVAGSLRAIFLHPQFRSAEARTGLVKQPIEYVAGTARALGVGAASPLSDGGAGRAALSRLATALGQEPLNPPNVGGWGQNSYWLDTATAAVRLQAALLLARRADLSSVGSVPPSQRPGAVADVLGVDGWGPITAGALETQADRPEQLVALALVSPDYVVA
ncbi:MAG TPA: DUF1800 domain-containing protein [Acidimicrobiales bacterium]|nr:DUF1800 domain-containing protein [Acidimicrobiales bacterium]